ncbi:MAG: MBL fold metallo-hydrolase [Nanoarchaeota archaeon]
MQASIVFLGTGQGSFVIGRDILSSGGFVIQVDENQFHIDPGPNSLRNAAHSGINLRSNTALLVSHAHLNHSNDVNAVIDSMTYSGFDKKGVLVSNKTVVSGQDQYKPTLLPHYRDFLERFIVLEAGQRVGINEVEIQALKTKHSEPNAIGFKFFTPYFTLSYSADTKYFPELIEEYKNSNILILNVPHILKDDAKDNLCIEDAIKIVKEVRPKLVIIQHFGVEMVKGDPLFQIREIQKSTGIQTISAKDGMIIDLISYSVDRGQRTLQAYPKEQKIEIRHESIKEPEKEEEPAQEEYIPIEEIKEQQTELSDQNTLDSEKTLKEILKQD